MILRFATTRELRRTVCTPLRVQFGAAAISGGGTPLARPWRGLRRDGDRVRLDQSPPRHARRSSSGSEGASFGAGVRGSAHLELPLRAPSVGLASLGASTFPLKRVGVGDCGAGLRYRDMSALAPHEEEEDDDGLSALSHGLAASPMQAAHTRGVFTVTGDEQQLPAPGSLFVVKVRRGVKERNRSTRRASLGDSAGGVLIERHGIAIRRPLSQASETNITLNLRRLLSVCLSVDLSISRSLFLHVHVRCKCRSTTHPTQLAASGGWCRRRSSSLIARARSCDSSKRC